MGTIKSLSGRELICEAKKADAETSKTPNRLLRVREVAERLAHQESAIRKWILFGRIPVVKIGKSVRIESQVVEKLIEEGRVLAQRPL